MRKVMLLLAVFGLIGSIWAADPALGTWKLNLAKSKIPASDVAKLKESITVMRAIDANTYEYTSTDIHKDGSKVVTNKFTVPQSGGIQSFQQGGPGKDITAVAAKIDPYTVTSVYLLNGKQVVLYQSIISKDGKTMTLTGKGTDPQGKPLDAVWVSEKQ